VDPVRSRWKCTYIRWEEELTGTLSAIILDCPIYIYRYIWYRVMEIKSQEIVLFAAMICLLCA
jgi:hypothetical protein